MSKRGIARTMIQISFAVKKSDWDMRSKKSR